MKTFLNLLIISNIAIADSLHDNIQDIQNVIVLGVQQQENFDKADIEEMARISERTNDPLMKEISKIDSVRYYEQAFWKDNGHE